MPDVNGSRSLLTLFFVMISIDAMAQDGLIQYTTHAVGIGYGVIDHSYVGSVNSTEQFDYEGGGFGLHYVGPQVRGTLMYGRAAGGRWFLDLSATGWFLAPFARIDRSKTMLAMPIGLLTAWRRVNGKNTPEQFNANAILFGTGGLLIHSLSRRTRAKIRAMTLGGITGSQVADAVGFSWAFDAEARLEFAQVLSDLGLTVGYSFRYQLWNVNGSRVFSDAVDELYDYAGTVQSLFIGVGF